MRKPTGPETPEPPKPPETGPARTTDGRGSNVLNLVLVVAGVILTIGVLVEWALGEGFDWVTSAWLLVLWPHGIRQLMLTRGRPRAAARAETVGTWTPLAAAALLWASLIIGWRRGEGTDWVVLVAALLLPLAGVFLLRSVRARRRA
ncbi:hypothetical protein [Streptomyces albireticuli]|uniref:hypothetical protein n=1 Tax=Streptomyces albireticuli TaxID=1940 RepID=UPI00368CA91A